MSLFNRFAWAITDFCSLSARRFQIRLPLIRIAGLATFTWATATLAYPEKIARNIVEKLLTYFTGASVTFADRREIDQIVRASETDDYGFRSLIHACVQSTIFQAK